MDRRGFLKMFGMGAAVAIVKPTYFFAPSNGWETTDAGLSVPMAGNEFLTTQWVSMKILQILQENLLLVHDFNRQYEQDFGIASNHPAIVSMRMPHRYSLEAA